MAATTAAGDRPEHQDDGEQPGGGRCRVLQQFQPGLGGGQALGGDARADHDGGQERAAEQFREQPPPQRHVTHSATRSPG
jgi:hypothetical protein